MLDTVSLSATVGGLARVGGLEMIEKSRASLIRGGLALAWVLLCSFITPAQASTVYSVTVNTTAISGIAGHLDFQFNAGANSRDASAAISSFTSNGTLTGSPAAFGNVTGGPLPATTTLSVLSNTGADYFHDFTFGSTLHFLLTLAFQAGNPAGPDDDTFGLALYNTDGITPLLSNGSQGDFILAIDLHANGTTTVHNDSTAGQVIVTSGVPEPSTLLLSAFALLALRLGPILRRQASRN